jgi:hypothetical protein
MAVVPYPANPSGKEIDAFLLVPQAKGKKESTDESIFKVSQLPKGFKAALRQTVLDTIGEYYDAYKKGRMKKEPCITAAFLADTMNVYAATDADTKVKVTANIEMTAREVWKNLLRRAKLSAIDGILRALHKQGKLSRSVGIGDTGRETTCYEPPGFGESDELAEVKTALKVGDWARFQRGTDKRVVRITDKHSATRWSATDEGGAAYTVTVDPKTNTWSVTRGPRNLKALHRAQLANIGKTADAARIGESVGGTGVLVEADYSEKLRALHIRRGEVHEGGWSDEDLKRYFVPGKSVMTSRGWYTIAARDIRNNVVALVKASFNKSGGKGGAMKMSFSELAKKVRAGTFGANHPTKGYSGRDSERFGAKEKAKKDKKESVDERAVDVHPGGDGVRVSVRFSGTDIGDRYRQKFVTALRNKKLAGIDKVELDGSENGVVQFTASGPKWNTIIGPKIVHAFLKKRGYEPYIEEVAQESLDESKYVAYLGADPTPARVREFVAKLIANGAENVKVHHVELPDSEEQDDDEPFLVRQRGEVDSDTAVPLIIPNTDGTWPLDEREKRVRITSVPKMVKTATAVTVRNLSGEIEMDLETAKAQAIERSKNKFERRRDALAKIEGDQLTVSFSHLGTPIKPEWKATHYRFTVPV